MKEKKLKKEARGRQFVEDSKRYTKKIKQEKKNLGKKNEYLISSQSYYGRGGYYRGKKAPGLRGGMVQSSARHYDEDTDDELFHGNSYDQGYNSGQKRGNIPVSKGQKKKRGGKKKNSRGRGRGKQNNQGYKPYSYNQQTNGGDYEEEFPSFMGGRGGLRGRYSRGGRGSYRGSRGRGRGKRGGRRS